MMAMKYQDLLQNEGNEFYCLLLLEAGHSNP